MHPGAWQLLLHCGGDYSQLETAWLSLLAAEGCIIHRRASEKHTKLTALVVGSTNFGLVLWDLEGTRYGSLNCTFHCGGQSWCHAVLAPHQLGL